MDIIKVGDFRCRSGFSGDSARKEKQEYSMFLSMAVCICIFYLYYHKGSDRVGICGEVRGDDRH